MNSASLGRAQSDGASEVTGGVSGDNSQGGLAGPGPGDPAGSPKDPDVVPMDPRGAPLDQYLTPLECEEAKGLLAGLILGMGGIPYQMPSFWDIPDGGVLRYPADQPDNNCI